MPDNNKTTPQTEATFAHDLGLFDATMIGMDAMIGAAKEPFFKKMLFAEIPEKVARFSPNSVLLVKKYEGVLKSVLKKIRG